MQTPSFESPRRWPRRLSVATIAALTLVCLFAFQPALQCDAQNAPGSQHGGLNSLPQPVGQPVPGSNDIPSSDSIQNERLLRALNADRQKSMISDTNKLLRLANELNADIARNNTDSLTAPQLHKVAEIEKLAHNIKDKMSTSVRGTPAFQPPFQPVHY